MRGHYRETPSRTFTAEQWAERERIGGRWRAMFALATVCGAFVAYAAGESEGWGLPAGLGMLGGAFTLMMAGRR
jgi:hypothetical protein